MWSPVDVFKRIKYKYALRKQAHLFLERRKSFVCTTNSSVVLLSYQLEAHLIYIKLISLPSVIKSLPRWFCRMVVAFATIPYNTTSLIQFRKILSGRF